MTNRERNTSIAFATFFAFVLLVAEGVCAGTGVVLLSFDTEHEPDATALQELAIDVPATFFFTGEYAMKHPELVRRLAAEGHTIGSHSHSHDHLTALSAEHLKQDLRLSKRVIEAISGVEVRWFRAPFLEYDSNVMRMVRAVGYSRDSSDIAHWPQNATLPELPISHHNGRLASDFELFERDGLTDQQALGWLVDAYDTRAKYGQPLVLLLHPRISVKHAEVLRDLIEHVLAVGGEFRTMDNYVDGLANANPPKITGLRVDLSSGKIDAQSLVSNALSIGTTDVFLSISDRRGKNYLTPNPTDRHRTPIGPILTALREANLSVHAWLHVNENPALAVTRPDLAMVRNDGTPSTRWLSPSNAKARAVLAKLIGTIFADHQFDGIHLDSIQYPGLEVDFSSSALSAFSEDTGIREADPHLLIANQYQTWVDWRMAEIADLTRFIGKVARTVAGPDILVSAALTENAATHFLPRERMGLSYRLMSRELDFVVAVPQKSQGQSDVDTLNRTLFAARWQIGGTPLVIAPAGFCATEYQPIASAGFEAAIGDALTMSDGIIYSYDELFHCSQNPAKSSSSPPW